MTMEFVHFVGNSTQDVIPAQKRENVYHVKAKNTHFLMTFALFVIHTWKDVTPVKTQLFARLA